MRARLFRLCFGKASTASKAMVVIIDIASTSKLHLPPFDFFFR